MNRILGCIVLVTCLFTANAFAQDTNTTTNLVNATHSTLTVVYQICKQDLDNHALSFCSTPQSVNIPAISKTTPNANLFSIKLNSDPNNGKFQIVVVNSAKNDISSVQSTSPYGFVQAWGSEAVIFDNFGTTTLFTTHADTN